MRHQYKETIKDCEFIEGTFGTWIIDGLLGKMFVDSRGVTTFPPLPETFLWRESYRED